MTRPRLLDLFCGQGGASFGYHQAGFDVVGVDIVAQPRYPFTFVLGDALEYVAVHGHEFDVIHASPPCQGYSPMRFVSGKSYPRLIATVRQLLIQSDKPYIIENVEGAQNEMINPLLLCGTMFGLKTLRHRLFEMSHPIYFPPTTCSHYIRTQKQGRTPDPDRHFITITGHFSGQEFARRAMGIDWMTRDGLAEAIPPAYTEFIGAHLLAALPALSGPARAT